MSPKEAVKGLLSKAGITVGGAGLHDISVHDERFYSRVLRGGSLALGESYMDGWWDAVRLDEFFYRLLSSDIRKRVRPTLSFLAACAAAVIVNQARRSRAFVVGETHYDIGNDLYEAMLGRTMQYSCAYWKEAATLDEAQDAKMKLICDKLKLENGMRVLDIGCGFGSLARYMARTYGVSVDGYTVSKAQKAYAEAQNDGLPVRYILDDYRTIKERYDRVVSVGMFEHVGYKNYRTFFSVAERALNGNGLMLLHTIGGNESAVTTDPWIRKYIFQEGMLPSPKQIAGAIEGKFVLEDWHSFGAYYDKTLMAWYDNFRNAWPKLSQNKRYTDRFGRMWNYYLLSCAGAFRARSIQLWQVVLSKHGVPGGYQSVR